MNCQKANVFKFIVFLVGLDSSISFFSCYSAAMAQSPTKTVEKRDSERKKERWQFSDYLTQKKKIFDMDLVYRMYTGQREKPYPRLEPMLDGGIASVKTTESSQPETIGQAYSGRATLHFNNFVTGIFKVPMPNIVPGAVYQIKQNKKNKLEKVESVGFSLRLFSKNQQDGALFLEGLRTKGSFDLQNTTNPPSQTSQSSQISSTSIAQQSSSPSQFIGWENRVRSQFYLFPSMGIQSGVYFTPSLFKQRALQEPTRRGWEAGGFLEFKLLRFGYLFQKDKWTFSQKEFEQESHLGFLSLTI